MREPAFCSNTKEQKDIIKRLLDTLTAENLIKEEQRSDVENALKESRIGGLLEFSRAVHAEMDSILAAGRKAISTVGTRMFVTTFPCHYCARHIVAAGISEVQYIEPYPKSRALALHEDSITTNVTDWTPPEEGGKVLFRPFVGIAPRLYRRAFLKDREYKNKDTGDLALQEPDWCTPWHIGRVSYAQLETDLSKEEG